MTWWWCFGDTNYALVVASKTSAVLYVLAMVAVVVGVDIFFFRHHFLARLLVNVGIVLVFTSFYLAFLKHR